MIFLFFSLVVLLIFALANVYIYKRLVRKFILFRYINTLFALVLTLLFFAQALFLLLRRDEYLSDEIYSILALLYAPTYCFFFLVVMLDTARLIRFLFYKTSLQIHMALRVFFEVAILLCGIFLTYASIHNALRIPEVKNVELSLDNLDRTLKIALLSDIHLGKNLHEDFLNGLIAKVNEQNVDMVLIPGDLIDTNPKNLEGYISKLDDFHSTYGTFYAVGNHEYYQGINEVLNLLRTRTNINILLNETKDLGFMNIAGLGDLEGLRKGLFAPDVARIKAGIDFSKPSIVLAHQPKTALLYDLSDFDLIVSGHTHGGQIFPFMFLVKLNQGFLHGLYKLGEYTQLYVTSGAGFWGPSIRSFADNEIVILNVKSKK
ncbi:metallophosphoesterase [Campylobacter sp. MIT 21-1685]|uniref:metallophosphoesterase n=1 Tax=unclassified Campylobacter TaxID=2593542 RepID=UPI00224B6FC1|nr:MULTISPECIES: metallophosphoesterase [unclassified Campylobacter]MCX2682754.1 metallophosphoesterase [Campylobacter sp. MIT 21-1684]MCX2751100.1 metallophosphoesterase [Campylobacter sp. MIT 21-1682]MCX2807235.1 metallophosphoesterase [Campylobacter sp. MIT 21-1685]